MTPTHPTQASEGEVRHTPGPLTVRVDNKWPFKIRTLNAAGDTVFLDDMPYWSTSQKNAAQCLSGKHLSITSWAEAVEANARAVADATLRANAPDLLEALQKLVGSVNPESTGWSEAVDAITRATSLPNEASNHD